MTGTNRLHLEANLDRSDEIAGVENRIRTALTEFDGKPDRDITIGVVQVESDGSYNMKADYNSWTEFWTGLSGIERWFAASDDMQDVLAALVRDVNMDDDNAYDAQTAFLSRLDLGDDIALSTDGSVLTVTHKPSGRSKQVDVDDQDDLALSLASDAAEEVRAA